jgi:hypothetical protein
MSAASSPVLDANPLNYAGDPNFVNVEESRINWSGDIKEIAEEWTFWAIPDRHSPAFNKNIKVTVQQEEPAAVPKEPSAEDADAPKVDAISADAVPAQDAEMKVAHPAVEEDSPLLKMLRLLPYEKCIEMCDIIVGKARAEGKEFIEIDTKDENVGKLKFTIHGTIKTGQSAVQPYVDFAFFAIKKKYLEDRGVYKYCANVPEDKMYAWAAKLLADKKAADLANKKDEKKNEKEEKKEEEKEQVTQEGAHESHPETEVRQEEQGATQQEEENPAKRLAAENPDPEVVVPTPVVKPKKRRGHREQTETDATS